MNSYAMVFKNENQILYNGNCNEENLKSILTSNTTD